MLLGNSKRFAIEFELDQNPLAKPEFAEWLYGRVRFWCGGNPVGRYEWDTTLRDVAIEIHRFLAKTEKRHDEMLFALPQGDVIRTLESALWIDHGQSDEQVRADAERYGPFVVSPEVDVFDPWRIVLVEGDLGARLIWQHSDEANWHECILERGEFERVLSEFATALAYPEAPK